jgi:hypothetical protein
MYHGGSTFGADHSPYARRKEKGRDEIPTTPFEGTSPVTKSFLLEECSTIF